MKKNRNSEKMMKVCLSLTSLILLLFLGACREHTGHDGVTDRIKAAETKPSDQIQIDSVPLPPAKSIRAQMSYQGGLFWVEARKEKIGRFQCSQCHGNQLARIDQAVELAHGDIVNRHGAENKRLACKTCHDDQDRNFLTSAAGEKIDFDHGYQLCGQCHFRQKQDWIGGAHGKRIGYWAGKRTLLNCTACHNPHAPKFAKRWPTTFSPPLNQ